MNRIFIAILCLASLATAQTTSQQHSTTEKSNQKTAEPTAVIETTAGNITCTLFPNQAPLSVANFIGLATGTKDWKDPKTGKMMHGVPLYDGTIFHRVIPNFMIQGGDPMGTGTGDPGYQIKDEVSSALTFNAAGKLAIANSGPNTNGSQFFITEVPMKSLNSHYSIFGQCQDIDVVKKIARLSPIRAMTSPTIRRRSRTLRSPSRDIRQGLERRTRRGRACKPALSRTRLRRLSSKRDRKPGCSARLRSYLSVDVPIPIASFLHPYSSFCNPTSSYWLKSQVELKPPGRPSRTQLRSFGKHHAESRHPERAAGRDPDLLRANCAGSGGGDVALRGQVAG